MCQPPEEHGHRDNPLHFDRRGQVPTFPESMIPSPRRPIRVSGPGGTLPKTPNPDSRPPPYSMPVEVWGSSPANPPYPTPDQRPPEAGTWGGSSRNAPKPTPSIPAFDPIPDQRSMEAGTWGGSSRNTPKPTPSVPAFGQHNYINVPDIVDGNSSILDLDPWEPFQPDLQPPLLPQTIQQPPLPQPLQPQPAFRQSLITCEWW